MSLVMSLGLVVPSTSRAPSSAHRPTSQASVSRSDNQDSCEQEKHKHEDQQYPYKECDKEVSGAPVTQDKVGAD